MKRHIIRRFVFTVTFFGISMMSRADSGSATEPCKEPAPGSTVRPGPILEGNTVTLHWHGVRNATFYRVIVRELAAGSLVVATRVTGTNYTAVLAAGQTYRWNVAAGHSDGLSPYTTPLHFQLPVGASREVGQLPITQDFIPESRKNRPGYPLTVKYITIHDTDNTRMKANAAMHAVYAKSKSAEKIPVSWHFTVDDHAIYQHLPTTENGWHAGDGIDGPGNRQSLGIEICMNREGERAQAEENAAWLVAGLAQEHDVTHDRIKQHYDWNRKNCPSVLRGRPGGWEGFLDRVDFYVKQREKGCDSEGQ